LSLNNLIRNPENRGGAKLRGKTILGATTSSKLPLMPSLVMTTMAGIQFPVPAAFSLRALAVRFPGEVTGMLALGWLSGDARARAVRDRWISIPREMRNSIEPEQLCQAAGIEPGQLVQLIVNAGYDLQLLDPASFMAHIMGMFARVMASSSRNLPSAGQMIRLHNRQVRRWKCRDMACLRKKLGLAARQFAQVFGVSLRTVQAWDGGECDPQYNQQVVVALVTRYVHRYGLKTFRQRFVEGPARYGKPGRLPVKR
jgi:DNA-binding transcriptional regulator YiaG